MAKKIVKGIGCVLLAMLIAIAFLVTFALAYLQQSYRLNPPTEAERAQNPALINFLVGGE